MPAAAGTRPWQVAPARMFPPARTPGAVPLTARPPLVTAPVMLPGNLLSPADSDFEQPLTGNWAAHTNAAPPAIDTSRSFSGAASLQMTALASGFASLAWTAAPCVPGAGYSASYYALTQAASRTGTFTVNFYDASVTLIGGTAVGPLPMTQSAWTPFTIAFTPPPGAVTFRLLPQVNGMGAGEPAWFDLVYAAKPLARVLIAWQTEPGSTTPMFADMTPFVLGDPPISMTRGRQDNLSEAQPGQLTLTCANDQGWLTPSRRGSPFYPNIKIGRRIQVSLPDETGTWHTRFDGQLNQIELTPAPTGLTMDCQLTAADILAALGRQDPLSSWTKEEIFLDSPALHWTLDDAAGSSAAAESSGNGGPPLQLREFGSGGSYAFAGGTAVTNGVNNGMESQTWVPGPGTPASFPSAYFAQAHAGSSRLLQGNWQLQAQLPAVINPGFAFSGSWTVEAILIPDNANPGVYTNAAGYTFFAFTLGDTRAGKWLGAYVSGGASPQLTAAAFDPAVGQVTFSASAPWNGAAPGPVAVAITITGSAGPVFTLYVNGVLVGSLAQSGAFAYLFNYLTAGGPLGGYQGWLGQLSCLSIYDSALSPARLAAHAQRAQSGAYGQRAGNVVSAIAGYAGIPPFWDNVSTGAGLSFLDYFDLAGSNALTQMQAAEQADGGLIWADAQGRLDYTGRETRMGAGAPQLTLTAGQEGQCEADLGYKINDQYLANEAAISSAGIAAGAVAQNAQSQADYGTYAPNGTAQSPSSMPLLTYNSWFQTYLNGPGGVTNAFSPDNLAFAAQWLANSHAQPGPKGASVRVDMATLPASGPDGIPPSQLFALDVNSVIALSGLPSQFPDSNIPNPNEYFVEGVSETVGVSEGTPALTHDLVLYTSPASQGRCWAPGDPVYGQLDSTAVIGRSAPAAPAVVPHNEFAGAIYPGPPYYPPSYGSPMNTTGFIGDLDQAGIWANLAQQLKPPLCVLAVASAAQSIPNSTGPVGTRVAWDTVYADTLGGNGWLAGFPNWYFVLVPGWWQLHAVVNYATNGAGRRTAWFLVAQKAAFAGTGPVTASANIIGTADMIACAGFPTGVCISAKIYCALGTAIAVQTWQTSGGALNTALTRGGSLFSARFLGDTATED